MHPTTAAPPSCARGLSLADRIAGAIYGLLIGDALAMPSHWSGLIAALAFVAPSKCNRRFLLNSMKSRTDAQVLWWGFAGHRGLRSAHYHVCSAYRTAARLNHEQDEHWRCGSRRLRRRRHWRGRLSREKTVLCQRGRLPLSPRHGCRRLDSRSPSLPPRHADHRR